MPPPLAPYELSTGENAHNAVLTEAIVREAFARRRKGEAIRDIASGLKVHWPTLSAALRGATWTHLKLKPVQVVAKQRCGECRALGHRRGQCPKLAQAKS